MKTLEIAKKKQLCDLCALPLRLKFFRTIIRLESLLAV